MSINVLILFSGTKSFSNNLDKSKFSVRTLDIEKKFNPYYCEDILKWNYKKDLKNFIVDYLHASPVCCHFSSLSHGNKNYIPNVELGFKLFDKSIEIIEWIKKNQNPNLKFTIENPKNKITLDYEPLKKFKYVITSYCKYGFTYQKDTIFWYGGFDLKLKERCRKKVECGSKKLTNGNYHRVRIGYKGRYEDQYRDSDYFKNLKKQDRYKKFTDRDLRYRIPDLLIKDIIKSLN
tara:strand:- start:6268 stop:6969 length:702 start_codon:yes stop_codon:yes gene_type:complete